MLQFQYLLNKRTLTSVIQRSSLFFAKSSLIDISTYQIERFNEVWQDAYQNIEFYRQWKNNNRLPDKISSLDELSSWPILSKKEIMESPSLIMRQTPPNSYVITSGSTGVPLKIPSWGNNETKENAWIGRAANGLKPGEKTFLIWGHHHLRGAGFARIKNNIVRAIKDYILGYKRVSAYDTSVRAMKKTFVKYQKFKPVFVVSYSSSMLAFVRSNKDQVNIHRPQLVLCTAGPLSDKEKDEIRTFFKCPLCMEYGSVECGVMAYSLDNCHHYNTFWNAHLIQGLCDEHGGIKNIVTNLSLKYFPLIRYDIGDYLDIDETENLNSILKINSIVGRPTDIVTLDNGTSFFAMLIEACVEHLDGLVAHQLVVEGTKLEILLVALKKLDESDIMSVREKLYVVVPDVKCCDLRITQVDELLKNDGGKTPIVIRK